MADTVTLTCSEAGQGTPVVLLHGFPLSGAIWNEQRQRLNDRFRVITPDSGSAGAPARRSALRPEDWPRTTSEASSRPRLCCPRRLPSPPICIGLAALLRYRRRPAKQCQE